MMLTKIPAKLMPILIFSIFFAGMSFIQFASPDLPDNDGFYHIKLAYLMRTEGLKPNFTWLPLSILNPQEFYDHHFLFHVAQIPFTFGDLRLGAKWSAVLFASLAFTAVWYLFRWQQIPYASLWALGLLGMSDALLYRMSVARAGSLSLLALALGTAWLLQGRRLWLGILAFLYVWAYDAFPLLLVLAGLHALAVFLIEKRLEWRSFAFVSVGILLGLVINPYFPDNVVFTLQHIAPKITAATAVSVGNEWYPYDTGQLLDNSLPALVALSTGILALGLSNRKMDTRTAFALLTVLLFGLMLFQSRRFIEYFAPYVLIFTAFAWSPLLLPGTDRSEGETPAAQPISRSRSRFSNQLVPLVLSAALLLTVARVLPTARDRMLDLKPYDLYASASAWLEQNTPAGELVFQTDWDDFPRLFFYNTHNTYLIGLDPTYLQLYDQEKYDMWSEIVSGDVEKPSQFIAKVFQARYVHTDLNHTKFLRQAAQDPDLEEVFRDDQAVIFQVTRP